MIENLHKDEPIIPASEGWLQMHGLLNEYLPVERTKPSWQERMRYAAAVLICMILLFSSLQLDKNLFHSKKVQVVPTTNKASAGTHVYTPHSIGSDHLLATIIVQQEGPDNDFTNDDQHLVSADKDIASNVFLNGDMQRLIGWTERINPQPEKATPIEKIQQPVTPTGMEKAKEEAHNPTWELAAGIAINAASQGDKQLHPYPVAEARLNLSKRFFLSAGITAWSPVNGLVSGVSKTTYLNDTINNIRLYNETTNYHHFHYADLPVMAGVNIGKHLSVQAGVQASVLLHKRTNKTLEPYDYQNSVVVTNPPAIVMGAVNEQRSYEVKLRNVDLRLAAGLRYTLNKASFGINYQHALQPAGKGNITTNSNNRLVSLNVLFKIK